MPEEMEQMLWELHKVSLMEMWLHPDTYIGNRFFAPRGPFTRPYAWWKYESKQKNADIPRNEKAWLRKHDHYTQAERLLEAGTA